MERQNDPGRCERAGVAFARSDGEHGESLIEILIAIALLGLLFTAVVGGFANIAVAARLHNQEILLEAALSQAKQSVANATYDPAGNYPLPASSPSALTFTKIVSPVPGTTTLQEITIFAQFAGSTRSAKVYKGPRE